MDDGQSSKLVNITYNVTTINDDSAFDFTSEYDRSEIELILLFCYAIPINKKVLPFR